LSCALIPDAVTDKIRSPPEVEKMKPDSLTSVEKMNVLIAEKEEQNIIKVSLSSNSEFQTLLRIDSNKLQSLTSLDLRCNEIDSEGCRHLSTGFQHLQLLTSLNLRNNDIDSECCRHLSSGFQLLRSLAILDLPGNNIGSESCLHLSTGFQHLRSFTSLNIQYNKIGSDRRLSSYEYRLSALKITHQISSCGHYNSSKALLRQAWQEASLSILHFNHLCCCCLVAISYTNHSMVLVDPHGVT